MISISLLVPPAYMYLVLWYLFVVSVLSVIVVLLVVKKGSRKRRSDLTGAKSKKNAPRFMIIEKKGKVLYIRIDQMPELTT